MPNTTLVTAFQTLREDYSRKQKATNRLLAALKGKSSALGKIQQALGEYAAWPDNENAAFVSVQQAFGGVQEDTTTLAANLGREAKTLAALTRATADTIAALNTDPVDVVKLSRPAAALQALEVQDERLSELLPALNRELDEAQQALGAVFGAALRQAFAEQEIAITGSTPKFEAGRFEIAANFLARSASIGYGKEVVIKRVPLSVEAVIKAYQSAVKNVTGRSENPDAWIAQFYSAWELARRKRDTADKRANIVDCYFEMVLIRQPKTFFSAPTKNSFAEYTRAQFAYDLFEIAIRPQRSYKNMVVFAHVATKSQTDSAARSMWIIEGQSPYDGRYLGDIVFDRNE